MEISLTLQLLRTLQVFGHLKDQVTVGNQACCFFFDGFFYWQQDGCEDVVRLKQGKNIGDDSIAALRFLIGYW